MTERALLSAGLQVFPCWTRYDNHKQKWQKGPRVPEDVNWLTVDPADPRLDWSGGTYGIVVPANVVIVDLDTQKGVTTQDVERFLGVSLNWNAAHIQNTISGGAHFAFRTLSPVRQSNNWIPGFDTRSEGKGFICSGNGYTPAGMFGTLALTRPDALPVFPVGTPIEQHDTTERPAPALPDPTTRDEATLVEALHYCDPTERRDWLMVGMGLRNYYHDDPEAGFALFDAWSRGEYWSGGCPPGYVPDTQYGQWESFKAERTGRDTVTIASVFHMAAVGGWVPPRSFDTSAAFCDGESAPTEAYNAVIDEIEELGADPRAAEELIGRIQGMRASVLQRALLAAMLRRQLKEAGLLTKELGAAVDLMIGVKEDGVGGFYGKNHTANALLFLERKYPDGTLVKVASTFYAYDGKIWGEVSEETILHQLALELAPIRPQASVITGTFNLISFYCHRADLTLSQSHRDHIIMQNGILNLNTLELMGHDQNVFSTNIMPYEFNPHANCPTWRAFLNDITEGDNDLVRLLQEWFGYMMTTDYRFQKILLILGPRRCGKGTIGRILNRLVGDQNFSGADLGDLIDNKFLETLPSKTVMFDGDVKKSFKMGAEGVAKKLKTISGNDKITIPRLYKTSLSETLPTRFTLAGNHIPRLFDDSDALSGRMMVIPLEKSFYGMEDLELFDKLVAEIEGIAIWALNGLMRLRDSGRFTAPEASNVEAMAISEQYSPVKAFAGDCLQLGGDGVTSSKDLYEIYRAYAIEEGDEYVLPRRTFTASFKDYTRGKGVKYGTHRDAAGEPVRGFKGVSTTRNTGTSEAFK